MKIIDKLDEYTYTWRMKGFAIKTFFIPVADKEQFLSECRDLSGDKNINDITNFNGANVIYTNEHKIDYETE